MLTLLLGLGSGAPAWACSGPGASEAIRISGLIALGSMALTLLCFLAALLVPPVRRLVGWRGVTALLAACVFHPGLWLSTLSGDCGFTARWASIAFLPILAGLIALLHWRQRRAR
jgi:hypothetical protein